jgi:hypothetical protein
VFFKSEYLLRGPSLSEGQIIKVEQTGRDAIELEIRQAAKGESPTAFVFTAESTSEKVADQFTRATEVAKDGGRLRSEGIVEGRPAVPQAVIEVSQRVSGRMTDYVKRVAKVLRWRVGATEIHEPIEETRGLLWSHDQQTWEPVPGRPHLVVRVSIPEQQMRKEIISDVQALVAAGHEEPLGHELFLEAMALRFENPRSSLLIGISAAEVGFKSFVGMLVPDAEWLALHAPTPPLTRMLTDYLPILPVKYRLGNPQVAPFAPKKMIETIKKGVLLRNEIAHAGGEVSEETLQEILYAVHDLLFLLDFYSGRAWAIKNVRAETHKFLVEEIEVAQRKTTQDSSDSHARRLPHTDQAAPSHGP